MEGDDASFCPLITTEQVPCRQQVRWAAWVWVMREETPACACVCICAIRHKVLLTWSNITLLYQEKHNKASYSFHITAGPTFPPDGHLHSCCVFVLGVLNGATGLNCETLDWSHSCTLGVLIGAAVTVWSVCMELVLKSLLCSMKIYDLAMSSSVFEWMNWVVFYQSSCYLEKAKRDQSFVLDHCECSENNNDVFLYSHKNRCARLWSLHKGWTIKVLYLPPIHIQKMYSIRDFSGGAFLDNFFPKSKKTSWKKVFSPVFTAELPGSSQMLEWGNNCGCRIFLEEDKHIILI